MIYMSLVLIFFSHSFYTFSGDDKGNGADVIICPSVSSKGDIRFLDFDEALNRRGITIDVGDENLHHLDILNHLLTRLQKIDSIRAHLYRNFLKTFYDESNFLKNQQLSDVLTEAVSSCRGGQIAQLVIQIPPRFSEDKRYLIDEYLWNYLSERDKAGVMLHEFYMREIGHLKDPVAVRYITSIVASKKISTLSTAEYFDLMKDLGFKFATYQDMAIDLTKEITYQSVNKIFLKSAFPINKFNFTKNDFIYPMSSEEPIIYNYQQRTISTFSFYHPRQITENWPYHDTYIDVIPFKFIPKQFMFYDNYKMQGQKIIFKNEKDKDEIFSDQIFKKVFSIRLWDNTTIPLFN